MSASDRTTVAEAMVTCSWAAGKTLLVRSVGCGSALRTVLTRRSVQRLHLADTHTRGPTRPTAARVRAAAACPEADVPVPSAHAALWWCGLGRRPAALPRPAFRPPAAHELASCTRRGAAGLRSRASHAWARCGRPAHRPVAAGGIVDSWTRRCRRPRRSRLGWRPGHVGAVR